MSEIVLEKEISDIRLEYNKCRDDIVYFAEKYINTIKHENNDNIFTKIKLREWQKDIIVEDGINATKARGIGFTTLANIKALHSIIFGKNERILFIDSDSNMGYTNVGYLNMMYETCTFPYKPTSTKMSRDRISFDNGSEILSITTSTNINKIRGYQITQLYMDECNSLDPRYVDEVMNTIYPCITSTSNSVFWMYSTLIKRGGNITERNYKFLKPYLLPYWVISDEVYIKSKYINSISDNFVMYREYLI
jgi:hypothetical protein